MELMNHDCTNEQAAEITYRPMVAIRIFWMTQKSMPPVPWILAMMPLNSSVVARESTFGPTMLNTVESTAKNSTTNSSALYLPMKASSLSKVPFRSLGFSTLAMLPGPWPGPRRGRLILALLCAAIIQHLPSARLPKAGTGRSRGIRGNAPSSNHGCPAPLCALRQARRCCRHCGWWKYAAPR